jgi:hypothetical protein
MKKQSEKQRQLDILIGLSHRQGRPKSKKLSSRRLNLEGLTDPNEWIERYKKEGLNVIHSGTRVTIILPERLNFNSDLEITALNFNAIRKLAIRRPSNKAYRLGSVNFDNLRSISTTASLVLTAELSKWNDGIRNRLIPNIQNWDKDILLNFHDLGFFDLFHRKPVGIRRLTDLTSTERQIVKYIKGRCGDDQKTRVLKSKIIEMIGDPINKWMFLHSGLSEAIVNVSHHAYPKEYGYSEIDKHWYLTASFDASTKELKVVFYDQGIGIPRSLPASDIWEKLLKYVSVFPVADRLKDETLLKAAVELDRTSTEESDRGKGLQDLLEFIRQRGDGFLSILSLKGLFELEIVNGVEKVKTDHFKNPVQGTLIIWSVIV